MASDVDLVILSENVRSHLHNLDFIAEIAPRGRLVRSTQWGPVHERRVRLPGGLLVEFGITAPDWGAVPLDAGTAKVLTDGCKILTDSGLIADALTALGRTPQTWQPVA